MPVVLPEGSQLSNRYQVTKILDVSPLRNVYLVQDLHLRTNTWVVKQIASPASDPSGLAGVRARFESEARLISSLDHPCIPKMIDFFFKDRSFFIVREYIPGTDLATLLAFQGGSLGEPDALRLTIPIIELLGFLLRKNMGPAIFRELSLHSFIVTPSGELRLTDLGFTRLFGNAHSIGSVDYAAPEQFTGTGMDARSLVYNAGALLYHVLAGFNPGESPFDLDPLEELAPETSDATIAIVEKAMQHNPSARYSTPEELVKALKKARYQVEKKRGSSKKGAAAQSSTQPLDAAPQLLTIFLAAIVLLFLGASCYAVYTLFLKGG